MEILKTYKQPLIIAAIIFGLLFVILTIYALSGGNEPRSSSPQENIDEVTIDPVSGERIIENSSLYHGGVSDPNSNQPVMLGFGKLSDYGISFEQQELISEKLTNFATSQDPAIERLSFYKDSYRQRLPDESGVAHMMFNVQADKDSEYYVDIAYSGISDAKVSVYKKDKKTLIFSE